MKPKEFLFEKKGYCFKGIDRIDYKNRNKGIIYVSATQLRIVFKKGGEQIIPLYTIKKLNQYHQTWSRGQRIEIQTDADEWYSFNTGKLTKLYKLLSKVIANLSDGGGVHVGPKPDFPWVWLFWIIIAIVGIMLFILVPSLRNFLSNI